MLKAPRVLLLSCLFLLSSLAVSAQAGAVTEDTPSFEAVTIKQAAPGAGRRGGFYGKPGGRIFFGGTVQMLAMLAFNLQRYQIAGESNWTASKWFEINAVPPEISSSRQISVPNSEPTSEQRLMLQSLLRDRFGFKSHFETKEGDVYFLKRGSKSPRLNPAKDPTSDPRAVVVTKQGGIIDGEAIGVNTTTDYLAQRLGGYLRLPVVNHTGITGSYDFDLPADNPENNDIVSAVQSVVDRLGLKLLRGRGPIQTLVTDQVLQPTEN